MKARGTRILQTANKSQAEFEIIAQSAAVTTALPCATIDLNENRSDSA